MTDLPAIIDRGQLSEEIGELLKSDFLPLFGTDDNPRAGTDFKETWSPPKSVTDAIKREARGALAQAEAELEPPDMDGRQKWLVMLGTLTATPGGMTAEQAGAKLAAYSEMLGHPRAAFTKGSVKRAGAKFKWFPSFAEINEFLDDEAGPYFRMVERLRALANAPLRIAPPRKQTEAERLAMGDKLGGLRRDFEAKTEAERAERRRQGQTEAQPISAVSQRLRESLTAKMKADQVPADVAEEEFNTREEAPHDEGAG